SWVTYREEWPRIQADIDAGKLSPMGLIQTDNLDVGSNHQVLAYAYEKSGQDVRLFIYDPNSGQQEIEFRFNVTSTDGEVHITRIPAGPKRIWCFFRTNGYAPKMPPSGRRLTSAKNAIRASSAQSAPYSIRAAIVGSNSAGSLTNWMRSL